MPGQGREQSAPLYTPSHSHTGLYMSLLSLPECKQAPCAEQPFGHGVADATAARAVANRRRRRAEDAGIEQMHRAAERWRQAEGRSVSKIGGGV